MICLLTSLPNLNTAALKEAVSAATLIGIGCLLALIIWIVMLSQIIKLLPQKKNIHKYLLWTFFIPYLNLLWVPWALIFTNSFIKKIQDRFPSLNLFNPASGIQILSVPLLILYLFWGVIWIILWKSWLQGPDSYEMIMYTSVVVVCVLIVFGSYLIYLSTFVHRVNKYLKSGNKH